MDVLLTEQEFNLIKRYIEDSCGIGFPREKRYLLQSRLSRLLKEYRLKSYTQLYRLLKQNHMNGRLAEQVIDAITVKETYWFRDKSPWVIIEELFLPRVVPALRSGEVDSVRIWSAACSTGQEAYSVLMCIDRYLKKNGVTEIGLDRFRILATDISISALQVAQEGKYDQLTITRGLDDHRRSLYFNPDRRFWTIRPELRGCIDFQLFNLCRSFASLGSFDLILCRYVTIYFAEENSKDLLRKMASSLNRGGMLLLGNSEIFANYQSDFQMHEYRGGRYYLKRKE